MARRPRLDLPGLPVHVTQRGVNRCAIFLDDIDRLHYLRLLRSTCARLPLALHAYVLMDNHVHLLLTTSRPGDLSSAMHGIGHKYVQWFNWRHERIGTLWQGRFKACVVDSDAYLLEVIRYIELNPVRAAMVLCAQDYPWSSVHVHLGRRSDPAITNHDVFEATGSTPRERADRWTDWLRAGVSDDDLVDIRRHMQRESALGDARFQAMVEQAVNRPVACRPRGRPPRRSRA